MAKAELVAREKNIARLKVELTSAEVDNVYRSVYHEYAKKLKIAGFRKGKVPPNIIRQRVGAENVDGLVGEHLKDYAIDQALAQHSLIPRKGEIDWHSEPSPSAGTAAACELSLSVLPDVSMPDYRSFELTVPRMNVTETMKERYRERLVERHTEFTPKNGPAGEGEAVELSFSSMYAEGGKPTPLEHSAMTYITGREGNLPGWDAQILGLRAGEGKEFECAVPGDFADQRVAGKKIKVSLKVKSVSTVQAPEINAAFVKEKLSMDSMEQFEDYLIESLNRECIAQMEQMKRELAMQKLVEGLEADITEDMVVSEIDGLVQENDRVMQQHGSSLDAYLEEKGQNLEDYRQSLNESALRKIKLFLAVRTVSDQEKLTASSEDFTRYVQYFARQEGMSAEKIGELLKHRGFVSEVTYQIMREKVVEHVAGSASFTEEEHEVPPAAVDA
ncbi:trigger factor [bacterium]|nr:trigger factor [bacterium]